MEQKIFNMLEKIYIELQETKKKVDNLEGRFDNLEGRFDNLEGKFDNLEGKVDKNTLLLEELRTDVKTIAEVQSNHMNQNENQHKQISENVKDETNIIKMAVTDIYGDVRDIKKDLSRVEISTAQNWSDIAKLKAVK